MSEQKMIEMLNQAKRALSETTLLSGKIDPSDGDIVIDEGTKNLIGQLILATVIDEAGTELGGIAESLNNIATR